MTDLCDDRIAGGRLGPQQARQGEAAKPQGPDPEETAAGQAVRDATGTEAVKSVAGRHWQPREVWNGRSGSFGAGRCAAPRAMR